MVGGSRKEKEGRGEGESTIFSFQQLFHITVNFHDLLTIVAGHPVRSKLPDDGRLGLGS